MKINRNRNSGAINWQAGLLALLLFVSGVGLFLLTCKPQAHALSKLSSSLGLRNPGASSVMSGQIDGPSMPSIDLIPKLTEKTTILLMGVDSNGLNTDPFAGTRTDTMMLVSINPVENKVGVVSIPRDSRVRIPNHGVDKINSAHAFGGAELSMQTVREAFGIPVDHYIEVDTGGLKKLFEILGPVEVLVEKEMHYVDHAAKLTVDLKPGLQTLSPAQTEQYLRFRHDARGDIGRIERQQWFLRQAAKKFKEPQIVLKLPQLVCLAYQCVRTDLSVQDVLSISAFAKDFPQERVVTAMLPGEGQMINGGSYWVADAIAGQTMFSRILGTSAFIQSASEFPTPQELSLPEDELPTPDSHLTLDYNNKKPLSVGIKYPKGCDQLSQALSEQLSQAGFKVKYRYRIAESDCQHELLVQQSMRANDDETNKIYQLVPELQSFPLSLAIEARPYTDFTLVLSPQTQIPSVCRNFVSPSIQQKSPPLNASANAMPVMPQE